MPPARRALLLFSVQILCSVTGAIFHLTTLMQHIDFADDMRCRTTGRESPWRGTGRCRN